MPLREKGPTKARAKKGHPPQKTLFYRYWVV